jgi:hypothetical protein
MSIGWTNPMRLRGLITVIAAALVTGGVSAPAAQQANVDKAPGRIVPMGLAPSLQSRTLVQVRAQDAKGTAIAGAEVRLRELASGRATASATASTLGECDFQVPPGTYVAELIARDGGVDSVSDATTVASGEVAQAVVRQQARSRSFAWWLGATTTAALAQAASLGVFAVDPGQPVSPQR